MMQKWFSATSRLKLIRSPRASKEWKPAYLHCRRKRLDTLDATSMVKLLPTVYMGRGA